MCRGKDGGGRRCPGHNKPEALAAHNQRRRDNRKIKANIIAWAKAQNASPDTLEKLRKASPKAVKDWAEERNLNPADFLESAPLGGAVSGQSVLRSAGAPAVAAVAGGAGAPRGGGGNAAAGIGGGGAGGGHGLPAGGVAVAEPAASSRPWETEDWAAPHLVDSIRAVQQAQGDDRDERLLLDGQGVAIAMRGRMGTNETIRIELDNGQIGYHKPFDALDTDLAWGFGHTANLQPVHEAAAWQLAKKMGPPWEDLVPPCVLREVNGRMGSFALERPGKGGDREFTTARDWKHAAFFDALIGQQDRHRQNFLRNGHRITLIDHGYAFARPGDYMNHSVLQNARAGSPLTPEENKVLDRLIASPDLFGLRNFLEPERAAAVLQRAHLMKATGTIPDSYDSLRP